VAFLEIDDVSKTFSEPDGGSLCVFKNVRLRIEKGQFVTMVGHSGCGKSTLLNIIAGLERSTQGGIVLDGKEIDEPGLDRMVVFQNFSLLPWMTVYENIRLAVKAAYAEWARSQIHEYTQRYIDMVGLAGAEKRVPAVPRNPPLL